ncbi:DUF6455 family protein [Pseudoponticoccus marisrubri]|uniref:DUF6455 domain-containing protein n=1 Tax=Pseudoponticoccus marisrubri TaxID=1685382 RepID=A0A0W7WI83_9RHOB|nr:DUF6455 family protein [Pseudoponticoccus marisrubri]KUF10214.1 hypothetical protein AVJ23_14325 [Pseudoponticoccus marisrubri]
MKDIVTGRPPMLGPETDHYWLVQRMAKATGVDLVRAWDAGMLSSEDWAGVVTRCRGCTWTEGCGRWLDAAEGEPRGLPTPCVNRERLQRIKDALDPEAGEQTS